MDENYQEIVTQDLDGIDAPTLNYYLAKKDSSDNLVLAPAGRVYNYSADAGYSGRITNLVSITVNYSGGTLFVQEGIGGDARQYEAKAQLTSGAMFTFATHPNHFMISNAAAETTITSISFKYTCEAAGYSVDRLGTTYNGKGSDGKVYTVTRDGSNVTVNVEDQTFNGTVEVDYQGNFTVNMPTLASGYTGRVSSDYRTLEVTGKTGVVPAINEFNRVYVVDDFESYIDRGVGFTPDRTSAFTATNLRAAYYVDTNDSNYVETGGTTWVSGSSFKVAKKDANFLNLKTNVKHGGSKAMTLQGRKAGWVRMWTVDTFNQNQHFNLGKGNRLSFWAHGAYTNPDLTTASSNNVKLRVQAYYQNFVITDSNRNSTTYGTGTTDITITAGSDWKEYTINLDPNKTVYAINIMVNNEGISASDFVFIPIDDITIYTLPVFERQKTYDESATRITKSYHGTVNAAGNNMTIKVAIGADGYVLAYCGKNMEAQSYEISGNQITIVTTGDYSGLTFGTWVGTLSNSNKTITIPKSGISGTIAQYVATDPIVLNENELLFDGSEGDLTTLEQNVARQYNNSGWKTDGVGGDATNADRFTFNSNYYIQGNKSLKVRTYGNGTRIIMQPSLAATKPDFDTLAFWVYAPADCNFQVAIYAYKTDNATGDNQQCVTKTYSETKADADGLSGWHYVESGLYNASGFGASFALWFGGSATQIIVDYATYF